jgi:hypothetical protein
MKMGQMTQEKTRRFCNFIEMSLCCAVRQEAVPAARLEKKRKHWQVAKRQ